MAGSLFQVISLLFPIRKLYTICLCNFLLRDLILLPSDILLISMSILQQYPYDIPTEAFPFEIFKQAFVAIQSCVVHLQVYLPC